MLRYTDDDLLEQMRRWRLRYGDPVSIKRWQATADPEFVHPSLITQRFEFWNDAKRRAGLPEIPRLRVAYRREFSDAACLAAVCRYVLERDRPSYHDFVRWTQAHDGPSAQLVRNRLGGWSHALKQARRELTGLIIS